MAPDVDFLPQLPEGLFWRLRSDGWGFMWVEIRRKRRWFGSREIEYGMVLANPPVDEAIADTAKWVYRKYKQQSAKAAFLDEFRGYEGDYR